MKTKRKKRKDKSHLQGSDGGDWSDHSVLQHSQLAPKEQRSVKTREYSISAIPVPLTNDINSIEFCQLCSKRQEGMNTDGNKGA